MEMTNRGKQAFDIISDVYEKCKNRPIKDAKYGDYDDIDDAMWIVSNNCDVVEVIYSNVEYDGDGTASVVVVEVDIGTDKVLLKFRGNYDSWNGTTWYQDPYEVKPKQITKTIYERV